MEEKIKQWKSTYVVSTDHRPVERFLHFVNLKDYGFAHTFDVRWTQGEGPAISALLHILSPESERNVRYAQQDSDEVLWLSCARNRVLAAAIIDYRGQNGVDYARAVSVNVKKMENPIHSRIMSTLAGAIPNHQVGLVFDRVRFYIPNNFLEEEDPSPSNDANGNVKTPVPRKRVDLVSHFSMDLDTKIDDPVLWHKLLAIVGAIVDLPTTPAHDHESGQVLCAVRIGKALLVVKRLYIPEATLVLHGLAQFYQ